MLDRTPQPIVTRAPEHTYHIFFSSRRRHTKSYGGWSSDVCSSDLVNESSRDSNEGSSGGAIPTSGWGTGGPHDRAFVELVERRVQANDGTTRFPLEHTLAMAGRRGHARRSKGSRHGLQIDDNRDGGRTGPTR